MELNYKSLILPSETQAVPNGTSHVGLIRSEPRSGDLFVPSRVAAPCLFFLPFPPSPILNFICLVSITFLYLSN
jgi:hypothetical protein